LFIVRRQPLRAGLRCGDRDVDGNLRSTIRVLIMANEYLENELQELQAAGSSDRAPARSLHAKGDAA